MAQYQGDQQQHHRDQRKAACTRRAGVDVAGWHVGIDADGLVQRQLQPHVRRTGRAHLHHVCLR